MANDPEKYSLPAAQLQAIYETRVAPRLFRGVDRVDRPTAIVLGGQPGAGKTPMQSAADQEFARRGGMAAIIGDDLRAYLPHYRGLQRADDKTAAFYTDRDSGRLVEKAIAEAASRRVNVLIEGTMRSADTVAATLERFRSQGYQTDARALAVSPDLSSLGILQRYAAQKESRGTGRMTTPEAHNVALRGMLETLDRIQDGRLADRLTIYRRGGEIIHSFDLSSPARPGEPRARAVVEQERNRPLSPEQAAYKQREIERLTPILQKHGVIPPSREAERRPDLAQERARGAPPRDADRDRERDR